MHKVHLGTCLLSHGGEQQEQKDQEDALGGYDRRLRGGLRLYLVL
jgi:hypothetical protein